MKIVKRLIVIAARGKRMVVNNVCRVAIFYALFAFVFAQSSAQESESIVYKKNVDNKLIYLFSSKQSDEGAILISKKFIGNRYKGQGFDFEGREDFFVHTTINPERIPLYKSKSKNAESDRKEVVVGRGTYFNGNYKFPYGTRKNGNSITLYHAIFNGGSHKIKKIKLKTIETSEVLRHAKTTLNGSIWILGEHRAVKAIHINKVDSGLSKNVRNLNRDGEGEIVDVYISDKGEIHFLIKYGNKDTNKSFIGVNIYQSVSSESPEKSYRIKMDGFVRGAEFINQKGSGSPSVLVLQTKGVGFFSRPFVSIYNVNQDHRVWSSKLDSAESYEDIEVIEVCPGKYLTANPVLNNGKRLGQGVELNFITKTNTKKMKSGWNKVERGVIESLIFSEGAGPVFLGINFNKYEAKRREKGWYSWNGFKVSRIQFGSDNKCLQ